MACCGHLPFLHKLAAIVLTGDSSSASIVSLSNSGVMIEICCRGMIAPSTGRIIPVNDLNRYNRSRSCVPGEGFVRGLEPELADPYLCAAALRERPT